jgi:hypothetical protein
MIISMVTILINHYHSSSFIIIRSCSLRTQAARDIRRGDVTEDKGELQHRTPANPTTQPREAPPPCPALGPQPTYLDARGLDDVVHCMQHTARARAQIS